MVHHKRRFKWLKVLVVLHNTKSRECRPNLSKLVLESMRMDSIVEPEEDFTLPPWGTLGRDITLGLVSLGSNLIMHVFNRLSIDGHEQFQRYVMHREPGTALLTVCNHTR